MTTGRATPEHRAAAGHRRDDLLGQLPRSSQVVILKIGIDAGRQVSVVPASRLTMIIQVGGRFGLRILAE